VHADTTFVSSSARRVKLPRPETCAACQQALDAGAVAYWEPVREEALCVACELGWSAPARPIGVLESRSGTQQSRIF
jgi:hypothetical protein